MDHEAAAPHVAELAAGRPPGEPEAVVGAHVAGCPECSGVLEMAARLREEVAGHGSSLFSSHPDAEALVTFAVSPDELATESLAGIGRHVRSCPTCSSEVSAARGANREPGARAWIARIEPRLARRWLTPALAAGLLLLLWPAYLGWFELPRLRSQVATLPAPTRSASPMTGAPSLDGPIASVLLTSGMRGVGEPVATIHLRPGSSAIALLVAADPALVPPRGPVIATLSDEDGHAVWRREFDAAGTWDSQRRVLVLMAPTAALHPGRWVLRLGAPGLVRASFEARFRVSNASPGENP